MKKLLWAALTYAVARSRRLRRFVPLLPVAIAVGTYLWDRSAHKRLAATGQAGPGAPVPAPAGAPSPRSQA